MQGKNQIRRSFVFDSIILFPSESARGADLIWWDEEEEDAQWEEHDEEDPEDPCPLFLGVLRLAIRAG